MSLQILRKEEKTSGRENVSDLVQAIKRETGDNSLMAQYSLDPSPLGLMRMTVTDPAMCETILGWDPTITEGQANQFSTDLVGNRSMSEMAPNMLKLLLEMQSGKWDPDNGETLSIIYSDGRLMLTDGQHRLKAAQHALTRGYVDSVTFTVITGMTPQSVLTAGTGKSRSAYEFLAMCSAPKTPYLTDVASAGRDLFRATTNPDGNPMRNVSVPITEGHLAEWLMNHQGLGLDDDDDRSVGNVLRAIRTDYADVFGRIANKKVGGINAGAKSWMTYLMWEFLRIDRVMAEQVLTYLATGQDVDLPKCPTPKVWIHARTFAGLLHDISQGHRAANKNAHDQTLVCYAIAWNHSRGRSRGKSRINGPAGIESAVNNCYMKDGGGFSKVPAWPGLG